MKGWFSGLKGLFAGLAIALVGNVGYTVFLYATFGNIGFYLMTIPSAIATFFVLKNDSIKKFISSVIAMVIGFVIWELVLNGLQIVNFFYYNKYPDAAEFSLGDGFAMAVIYGFDFIGTFIGTIGAFIVTAINQRKTNKNSL